MENKIDDLDVIVGEIKKVKVCGKIYSISPTKFGELKKLGKLISQLDEDEAVEDNEIIADRQVNLMCEIVHMGLKNEHPDMTIEKVKKEFTLLSFPPIYKIMLELNDFFSEMKDMQGKVISLPLRKELKTSKNLKKKKKRR